LKIVIDTREDSAVLKSFVKLQNELVQKGLQISDTMLVSEALPIGDVLISDEKKSVIIERKTIGDFVNSMHGHLQKQLLQQDTLPNSYLIIVGRYADLHWNNLAHCSVEQFIGGLASVLVRYKTTVAFVDNNSQFAKLCLAIFNKTDDGKIIDLRDTELMRDKLQTEDVHVRLFASLPQIGIELGTRLEKKFALKLVSKEGKTIEDALNEIDGVGAAKKKIIMDCFST